jgi:hypothetical protein
VRRRSYGLAVDESGTRVLLLRRSDGWEIPRVDADEPTSWHLVAGVNRAFGELLGLELTTLRCLSNTRVDGDREVRFYELETHGDAEPRAGTAWVDRDEVERAGVAEPDQRGTLVRCLAERGEDGGPFRVAWARPGWFGEAAAWIRDCLRELGVEPAAVVQERTWSISTILRAETGEGDFYFKAVGPMFAGEPAVTRELGRRHAAHVPEVAAADEERGWMLMRDFGGSPLSAEGGPSPLADALRAYARMQVAWIGRGDQLVAIGCPDRTLATLEARIEPLLGDSSLLLPGRTGGLSETELAAVPALAERLHGECERLRGYRLPATLDHGDFHTKNVQERDGGFVFFDWSDACLSVPFFSLVPFLEYHPLPPGLREPLRDAYLEPWAELLGTNALADAFELAHRVGLFHQAISFHRITEQTEPRARWEWERGFPHFVKLLLRSDR